MGLVQAAKRAPSSRHSNVTPARLLVNANVADWSVVGFAGCEVRLGAGAAEIVHWYVVVAPVPLALRARTRNVWLPTESGPG